MRLSIPAALAAAVTEAARARIAKTGPLNASAAPGWCPGVVWIPLDVRRP